METKTGLFIIIAIVAFGGVLSVTGVLSGSTETQVTSEFEGEFETFDSKEAFETYLTRTDGRRGVPTSFSDAVPTETDDVAMAGAQQRAGDAAGSSRTSDTIETRQTNVQESGVGEPDIVKVTDNYTYYSQDSTSLYHEPQIREDTESLSSPAPRSTAGGLHTIQNPNTGQLNIGSTSSGTGELLRSDTRLVVYNDSLVVGYDITNDEKTQLWELPLNESTSVVTTRRIDDMIYFVARDRTAKCPIQPIETRLPIECTDIYRPAQSVSTTSETVYTAFTIDMDDGTVEDEMAFLGSDTDSSVYMSANSLYVSYEVNSFDIDDVIRVVLESDEFESDPTTETELQELLEYDLSSQAKQVEFENIISEVENPQVVQQNISKEIDSYLDSNKRDLFRSQIVKISASDGELSQSAMGSVPGVPLNQFAFDEQDGGLRLATTVLKNDRDLSENDLYVLNDELEIQGSVQGMADGQRVYAVRFIDDRGYLITYRQVDPLHVIDLSESTAPEEVGTLKLPGFSEYLHPVGDDLLVGVGESQDGHGKVVLFDVQDASAPQVADDLVLADTYSTAVSESHHAFMNDGVHQNAFIPAGDSMYVINYSSETLNQEKVIPAGQSAKRTRLYNDQVVVFSETQLTAFNRTSYSVETTVPLPD
jgi:uncharacterized secreted protein with C-terminal beta-propeller domain